MTGSSLLLEKKRLFIPLYFKIEAFKLVLEVRLRAA